MPQIVVSYSDGVQVLLDREGFARDLHRAASTLVKASLHDFKTRFVPIESWFIDEGEGDDHLVHVEIGLLDGRTEVVRAEVARLALELLRASFFREPPANVHLTVEVREIHRASFVKHITA